MALNKAQRIKYEKQIDYWLMRRDAADRVFKHAMEKWREETSLCDVRVRESIGNLAK